MQKVEIIAFINLKIIVNAITLAYLAYLGFLIQKSNNNAKKNQVFSF